MRDFPNARATGAVAALVLAVVLGACGSDAKPPGATGTTSPTPGVSGTTPATSPAGTVKPATSDPSKRPSASAKPSPDSTAPGTSITLDLKCARRGVDTQGITFKTQANGPVGFQTVYSDGTYSSDGKSNYSSGFGGAFADAQGNWRTTWTVPSNAPTGVATVITNTVDGRNELKFTVVDATASCPS